MRPDQTESRIYSAICGSDGIKAREIAKVTGIERSVVNHYLYSSPYMHELCYQDSEYCWHGLIRQARPHTGLGDFSGYYGTVDEFLALTPEEWFEDLCEGCTRIGRNLNDTRGLFHSFTDCRQTMETLFADLEQMGFGAYGSWELAFEFRINKGRYIRIYADVLLITGARAFSLEFKMKDAIDPDEVSQAAKYCPYLEVLFGPGYDVIPVLVLTGASDLYTYRMLGGTTAEIPVCSGDMLFNIIDEYEGIL